MLRPAGWARWPGVNYGGRLPGPVSPGASTLVILTLADIHTLMQRTDTHITMLSTGTLLCWLLE